MPPGRRPPTPADIIRVTVTGDIGGQPFALVFHCQTDEPGISTSAGVTDFITAFRTALTSSTLFANFSNTLHVTGLQGVVQLTPDTAVESQITASINGGSATPASTAASAVVLSWLSAAYWRGGKPRTYLPGVTTGMIDTNHSLADANKASILSAATSFLSAVNAITTPAVDSTHLGFVSYASDKEWRSTPVFFPFTGVTIHDRLGSQRRRLGRWLR
jgi:hypothetical protein